MTTHRVVLDCLSDFAGANPCLTDMQPVEDDLDKLFQAIRYNKRSKLFDSMSRIEVLARIAWGSYRVLCCLAASEQGEQSAAAANLLEMARWLVRLYPMEPNLLTAGGSGQVRINEGMRSPGPKGKEAT